MLNKKIIYALINAILPLFAGCLVYLFFKPTSMISMIGRHLFGEISITNQLKILGNNVFINCYLTDMLWSYSFMSAMLLTVKNNKYISVIALCVFMNIILEMIQIFEFVYLVFDPLDIAVQMIGSLVAIIVFFERRCTK